MLSFFAEDIDFEIIKPQETIEWLKKSILSESKNSGEINFIFCSDEYLLKMNKEFLNHDTYTDIITFNYVEGETISGDLFISIDRVKENADAHEVDFLDELKRVMIHGVLHLIGYDDKTVSDAQEIRAKEDFYLALQS